MYWSGCGRWLLIRICRLILKWLGWGLSWLCGVCFLICVYIELGWGVCVCCIRYLILMWIIWWVFVVLGVRFICLFMNWFYWSLLSVVGCWLVVVLKFCFWWVRILGDLIVNLIFFWLFGRGMGLLLSGWVLDLEVICWVIMCFEMIVLFWFDWVRGIVEGG